MERDVEGIFISSSCYGREFAGELAQRRRAPTALLSLSDPRGGLTWGPTDYENGFTQIFWECMHWNGGRIYDAARIAARDECCASHNYPLLARAQNGEMIDRILFSKR
jgi:hypothetical protein